MFNRPVEYLAQVRPIFPKMNGMISGELIRSEYVLVGKEPCAGALDKPACTSALERERAAIVCDKEPCAWELLATSGNSVVHAQGPMALQTLLPQIDTELEAALAAFLADGSISCPVPSDLGVDGGALADGTRVRAVADGYEVSTLQTCLGSVSTGTTMVARTGETKVLNKTAFCFGRRPAGLSVSAVCATDTELGAHFAEAARLEAASVFAFEQLARDLTRLGAPARLIAFARRSAREEIDHTHAMRALAQRFKAELAPVEITPEANRDALAIALENAIEGCVRETYGALMACYQADTAEDPEVRAIMARVFADETRHAQLAWEIAAWLEPQLCQRDRETVEAARSAAYAELLAELEVALSGEARALIGMPSAATAATLLAQLDGALMLRAA